MATKRELRDQAAAERKAAKIAERENLVPNPNYRKRLTFSQIYRGIEKPPKLIPRQQLD